MQKCKNYTPITKRSYADLFRTAFQEDSPTVTAERSYADLLKKSFKGTESMIKDMHILYFRLEEFTQRLDDIREQLEELKLDISKSKAEEKQKQMDEQWQLRKTINIYGIPFSKDERPVEIIMTVCRFVDFEFREELFSDIHRTLSPSQRPTRTLVCTFNHMQDRNKFLDKIRRRKKDMVVKNIFQGIDRHQNIFVNEAMTIKNSRLYNEAKRFQKEGIIKYVWFRNGKVCYREHGEEPSFGFVTDASLQSWKVISDFFKDVLYYDFQL